MKRKLFLIFHGRFPGEKAASLFAAKSAEAFARAGLEVIVLVPHRKGIDSQTAYHYFGVPQNFSIVEIPTVAIWPIFKKISFWLSYRSFSNGVATYLKSHVGPDDIIYSNETLPLLAASAVSSNLFYEMHDFPESKFALFKYFLSKVKWMLVHTQWKVERVKKDFSVSAQQILYEPNAVEVSAFHVLISTSEARKTLDLPLDKKIVVYTGHLYGWKGVDTLAQAAKFLPDVFLIVFVGGTDADVIKFKETYGKSDRILIVGHKPHKDIPLWQKAADVLVLPNTAREKISAYYTSPMKLFEYMASGKPIVVSDIPSIREIVDEQSAFLVKPDDAEALARGIRLATTDVRAASVRADKAQEIVAEHTWDKRAGRIITFINSR
jgi:glycosyltransferase involved in cell wall biosynthesis